MTVKKGKYKAAVVLTIIGWIGLIVALGMLIYYLNGYNLDENEDLASIIMNTLIYSLFIAEPCCIISFFLNRSYRKANKEAGIPTGKLCTFIYIITIIGLIPLLPTLLIGLALALFDKVVNKIASIPNSSNKIEVVDDNGDKHKLTHSTGKNYRDEDGNWWTSNDGKKFTKD